MTVWTELDRAVTAAGDEILLRQREDLYEIRFNGIELMSNLNHQSEGVLAERSLRLFGLSPRHVLIGGLGMGFTLRMALDFLGPETKVTVCELIPEVIEWNRNHIGHLAGHPLRDPRVRVVCADVMEVLAGDTGCFDVILMDTDNGPDFIVRDENKAIYENSGLDLVRTALTPEGIACFWSATISAEFERGLSRQPWFWRRDDVALMPGRVDACHHLYFSALNSALISPLKKAA